MEDWHWEKHILVMKWLLEMIPGSKLLSPAIVLLKEGEGQPN